MEYAKEDRPVWSSSLKIIWRAILISSVLLEMIFRLYLNTITEAVKKKAVSAGSQLVNSAGHSLAGSDSLLFSDIESFFNCSNKKTF